MTFAEQLSAVGAQADAEIAALRKDKAALTAQVAELEERILELENPGETPPPTPAGGIAVTGSTAVLDADGYGSFTVAWTEVKGSTGYRITRSEGVPGEGVWTGVDGPEARSREMKYLRKGGVYTVTVEAISSGAKGSVQRTVPGTVTTPPVTPPTQPVTPPVTLPPSTGKANLGYLVMPNQSIWSRELAAMKESGADWAQLCVPNSSPNPAMVDEFVRYAKETKEAGIKVWMGWANLTDNAAWTDDQFNAFHATWLKAFVQKAAPYVDLWRIYNECSGNSFRGHGYTGGKYLNEPAAPAYLQRLKTSLGVMRNAIRAGGSNAPLTTTPFGYPVDDAIFNMWVRFWDGIHTSCDVIGVHAYPEKSAGVIAKVPAYMKQLKGRYNMPVCIGEFGLPNTSGYGGDAGAKQAVIDQFKAIATAEPFAATLFQLRDRNGLNHEGMFGVLKVDGSKKTYFDAVAVEVRRLNA